MSDNNLGGKFFRNNSSKQLAENSSQCESSRLRIVQSARSDKFGDFFFKLDPISSLLHGDDAVISFAPVAKVRQTAQSAAAMETLRRLASAS